LHGKDHLCLPDRPARRVRVRTAPGRDWAPFLATGCGTKSSSWASQWDPLAARSADERSLRSDAFWSGFAIAGRPLSVGPTSSPTHLQPASFVADTQPLTWPEVRRLTPPMEGYFCGACSESYESGPIVGRAALSGIPNPLPRCRRQRPTTFDQWVRAYPKILCGPMWPEALTSIEWALGPRRGGNASLWIRLRKQIERMKNYLTRVASGSGGLIDADPRKPYLSTLYLLNVGKCSTVSPDWRRQWLDRGISIDPNSTPRPACCGNMISSWKPRWGGSLPDQMRGVISPNARAAESVRQKKPWAELKLILAQRYDRGPWRGRRSSHRKMLRSVG